MKLLKTNHLEDRGGSQKPLILTLQIIVKTFKTLYKIGLFTKIFKLVLIL